MRRFWQWICGYICINVRGRQLSRFLNLCSRNGIRLWRIRYDVEHSLRANLRLLDFYDLKPYLRKTKTKIRIISKRGFPFWCYRHPKLKWFFCLTLICICIGCYSLNYVWDIRIQGNSKVSTLDILTCLKSHQVDVGLKKQEIDCSEIETFLRENFHQIGWTSVYLDHTNLCIEVKESLYDVMEGQDYIENKQYDFVANKDATILSIVTRTGTALVQEGQDVKKGDILVLGQSVILDDSGENKTTLFIKADAQVEALVVYDILIPISEIELLAKNLSALDENTLTGLSNRKLEAFIHKIESKGSVILKKEINIEKSDRKLCFLAKIYAREQIGINIPAEEVRENEFE